MATKEFEKDIYYGSLIEYIPRDYTGSFYDEYHKALKLINQRDYSKGRIRLEAIAKKGDKIAQCALGIFYSVYPPLQNTDKALQWYKKSANQGYAPAQSELGLCYLQEKGVKQDNHMAFSLIKKAADQNFPKAFHNIALLYKDGIGIKKDIDRAIKWMKRAVKEDNDKLEPGFNYFVLGTFYLKSVNDKEAASCFECAVNLEPVISVRLAAFYYKGIDPFEYSQEKGMYWEELARKHGFNKEMNNYHEQSFIELDRQLTALKTSSACFIATAVYQSSHAPQVMLLRQFRDDILIHYSLGQHFIKFYNKYSPAIASSLQSKRFIAEVLKIFLLNPIVYLLDLFFLKDETDRKMNI